MRVLTPAVLAFITLVGAPAFADKLPLPKASYSADVTFESKGRETTGHINVDGPKERREIKNSAGQTIIAIIRRDKGRVYNLKPQRHLAIALRVAAAEAAGDIGVPGVDIDALYGADATPQGTETVAGLQTTKYGIEIKEAGGDLTVDATVWCTDDGIIARVVGKTSLDADYPPARMELKNIAKGPQDAALFEVPPGMSILSTDGDSDTPETPAAAAAAEPAGTVTTPAPAPAAPASAPPPADKNP
jgi:hypothetical protein